MSLDARLPAARAFADERHATRNQRHSDRPYVAHLDEAVEVLIRYGERRYEMLAAAYLHDVIEDCGISAEQLRADFGDQVATLVVAVTNEPGKNRKERQLLTYPKIKGTPGATKLKLADRIANAERSVFEELISMGTKASGFLNMYRKEHSSFSEALRVEGEHEEMWAHLDALMNRGLKSTSQQ